MIDISKALPAAKIDLAAAVGDSVTLTWEVFDALEWFAQWLVPSINVGRNQFHVALRRAELCTLIEKVEQRRARQVAEVLLT